MIELLTADTPNGKKISIMLEEIECDYKVTKVNILKDEQFRPEFILVGAKIIFREGRSKGVGRIVEIC